jgi:hypothetical protein
MNTTIIIQSKEPKFKLSDTVWLIHDSAVKVTSISALEIRATYDTVNGQWHEHKVEHWYWLPLFYKWFPEWALFPDKASLFEAA